MTYIEIKVTAPEESRDAIMNRMNEIGALGFIEHEDGLTAYFDASKSAADISDEMQRFGAALDSAGLQSGISISCSILPEKDWNETWKGSFSPINVGEKLVIVPSWLQTDTERVPIIIDPGMVFGTGHHETTRTCLLLIERLAKSGMNRSFLDIGTGTGILAIGASRLGFEKVTAVDIDPLSIDAASRNVLANSLVNVDLHEGDISSVSGHFDCIAANLLSEILVDIAGPLSEILVPSGWAILSGMLLGQDEKVVEAMISAGLSLEERIVDGKWVTVVMKKA